MLINPLMVLASVLTLVGGSREYQKKDLHALREEVRVMFDHAYSSYLKYAYPYDELRSLSCDGFDTWGSFSLTLIDALDTLAVMGNFTEFRRVAEIISARKNFEANINVSVFETNIRVVGGLLSAHLLSKKAGMKLEPGWPCNGPLLRLAEDMAKRLLPAFDTPTGMPYGTVNLKHGVPEGETSITCTAGIGTYILEFGTLSRLTGDPLYEEVAMNAIHALQFYRSKIGLLGNHVDVLTGHWTATDSGIGAGVDSYFEYLAKGTLLLQDPFLAVTFNDYKKVIEKYLRREDWHLWVSMSEGQVTLPVFQSLDAYWPGVLSLFGQLDDARKSLHNYHRVWKHFGFTPEFYNIAQGEAGTNRESYPLRPEFIESVMYLYRATKDPYLIQFGVDVLRSLQHSARTTCGYATINDVRDHRKADRMESFFLAETTKYLYLLFDTDNFIHNNGQSGDVVKTQWGVCVVDAGGYVFNTEAHPIDPGALSCCRPLKSIFNDKISVTGKFVPEKSILEMKSKDYEQETFSNDFSSYENFDDFEQIRDSKLVKKSEGSGELDSVENKGISSENTEISEKSRDFSGTSGEIHGNSENCKNCRNSMKTVSGIEISKLSDMKNRELEERSETEDIFEEAVTKFWNVNLSDDSKDDSEESSDESIETAGDAIIIEEFDDSDGSGDVKVRAKGPETRNKTKLPPKVEQPVKKPFVPQALLEKIRRLNLYPRNDTTLDYQVLSCAAQPFLQRISIVGEFY